MYIDWNALGSVYYKKWTIYDMAWTGDGINLEDCEVFGAPFGGPLALIKDKDINRKASSRKEELKWSIYVYTSSGNKLSEVKT